MRVEIRLTEEAQRMLRRRLNAINRWDTLHQKVEAPLKVMAGRIQETELSGQVLKTDTANLKRSVDSRVRVESGVIIGEVGVMKGPATAYARIHEFGGTIRPTTKKALAVPIGEGRLLNGKPRFRGGPKQAEAWVQGKGYKGLFVIRSRGGNVLLGYSKRVAGGGAKSRFVPLFVLKKEVKIPARRWLSGGIEKHLPEFQIEIQKEIEALLS